MSEHLLNRLLFGVGAFFAVLAAFTTAGLVVGWVFDHLPLTGYYPPPRGEITMPSTGDIARYAGVLAGVFMGLFAGFYVFKVRRFEEGRP